MANELRVRQNFVGGKVEDNPLTSGATTLTSAALAAVGVIGTTQHFPIVLDPDGVGGEPEIIWVTAHTASATTATVLRGQEGTTARAHNRDTDWVHGPTKADVDRTLIGARNSRTTALTIPNNTWTAMPWADADDWDTHGFHDPASNNTRFTVPTGLDGKYLISAQHFFASNTGGTGRYVRVIKNGVTTGAGQLVYFLSTSHTGGPTQYIPLTTVAALVAGDYVELQGLQDSGSALDVANSGSSWMSMTYLGA